jgi:hypothetical protein
VQKEGLVIHLVARRLFDLSDRLQSLLAKSRDIVVPDYQNLPPCPEKPNFESALARADEVKRPGNDQRTPARPRLKLQPSRDFH